MSTDPLTVCNDVFRKYGKAFLLSGFDIDVHHVSEPEIQSIKNQLDISLGPDFRVFTELDHLHIASRLLHRASA